MSDDRIMILGLPSREHVRAHLQGLVRQSILAGVNWIRVAAQLRRAEAGSKLYILDGTELELERDADLVKAIADRGVKKIVLPAAEIAEVLA